MMDCNRSLVRIRRRSYLDGRDRAGAHGALSATIRALHSIEERRMDSVAERYRIEADMPVLIGGPLGEMRRIRKRGDAAIGLVGHGKRNQP